MSRNFTTFLEKPGSTIRRPSRVRLEKQRVAFLRDPPRRPPISTSYLSVSVEEVPISMMIRWSQFPTNQNRRLTFVWADLLSAFSPLAESSPGRPGLSFSSALKRFDFDPPPSRRRSASSWTGPHVYSLPMSTRIGTRLSPFTLNPEQHARLHKAIESGTGLGVQISYRKHSPTGIMYRGVTLAVSRS
jgi:hypothetical protein